MTTTMPDTATERDLIPVLDVGPFLAGEPGAAEATAARLRDALEQIGFFFVVNHGIDWSLVDAVYGEARRLHASPDEVKGAVQFTGRTGGYLHLGGGTSYASQIAGEVRKPNLNAAYFLRRDPKGELAQWPPLEGFQEQILRYMAAMEDLAIRLLPLYALALGVDADYFGPSFAEPAVSLRMSHYPLVPHEEQQWGLAPHTDSTFMTLLPSNDVPGLEIRPEGHDWIAPPPLEQAFLVNSGDILRRWTNDRFLSTGHRVLNRSGRDRYAIPYFVGPSDSAMIEAIPTCVSEDNPARYEPITSGDYQRWFMNRNYANVTGEQAGEQAP